MSCSGNKPLNRGCRFMLEKIYGNAVHGFGVRRGIIRPVLLSGCRNLRRSLSRCRLPRVDCGLRARRGFAGFRVRGVLSRCVHGFQPLVHFKHHKKDILIGRRLRSGNVIIQNVPRLGRSGRFIKLPDCKHVLQKLVLPGRGIFRRRQKCRNRRFRNRSKIRF